MALAHLKMRHYKEKQIPRNFTRDDRVGVVG